MVTGFTTMPDSNFFTWATWAACSSGSRLRWITPMPPACAMAMASFASVTVSMAEEMTGIWSEIERVTREETSASFGSTLEAAGLIKTSSKVSAMALSENCFLLSGVCPSGIGQPHARGGPNVCGATRSHRLAASFSSLWAVWEALAKALRFGRFACGK